MSAAGGIPPQRPDQEAIAQTRLVAAGAGAGSFRARVMVIFGLAPRSGIFVYQVSSPAPKNLIGSVVADGGTDGHSNVTISGFTSYQPAGNPPGIDAVSMTGGQFRLWHAATEAGPYTQAGSVDSDGTDVFVRSVSGVAVFPPPVAISNNTQPALRSGYSVLYSSTGQLKYVAADGNAYATGRMSLVKSGDQTVNSATPTALTDLSGITVEGGTYRLSGVVLWTQTTSNTGQQIGLQGTPSAPTKVLFEDTPTTGTALSFDSITLASDNTLQAFGTTVASGAVHAVAIDGVVTFSGTDTFGLRVAANGAINTWVAKAGSWLDLEPVP